MRYKVLLVCCCILLSFSSSVKSEEYISHVNNGSGVPSFSVTTIDGHSFNVSALKGKLVLLNFWATWCAPCRVEMPLLEKEIWTKYKGYGFEMIAIARKETDQKITDFQKSTRFTFPLAADPEGKVYYRFATAGIPRNYLIGPDGKVIYQTLGYTPADFDKLTKIIARELEKIRSQNQPDSRYP